MRSGLFPLRNPVDTRPGSGESPGNPALPPSSPKESRLSLEAGKRLGPYEIIEPLGAGGMGEVYKARDTRLDRSVAIKVLPPHLSENPEVRQRFEREARAVSSLNHPNICTLFDVGHEDGIDYLVMEHIEGETISTATARPASSPRS